MLRKFYEISEFKEIKNDDIVKIKVWLCVYVCRKFMENFVVKGVIFGFVFCCYFCLFVFEWKCLLLVGVVM